MCTQEVLNHAPLTKRARYIPLATVTITAKIFFNECDQGEGDDVFLYEVSQHFIKLSELENIY